MPFPLPGIGVGSHMWQSGQETREEASWEGFGRKFSYAAPSCWGTWNCGSQLRPTREPARGQKPACWGRRNRQVETTWAPHELLSSRFAVMWNNRYSYHLRYFGCSSGFFCSWKLPNISQLQPLSCHTSPYFSLTYTPLHSISYCSWLPSRCPFLTDLFLSYIILAFKCCGLFLQIISSLKGVSMPYILLYSSWYPSSLWRPQ